MIRENILATPHWSISLLWGIIFSNLTEVNFIKIHFFRDRIFLSELNWYFINYDIFLFLKVKDDFSSLSLEVLHVFLMILFIMTLILRVIIIMMMSIFLFMVLSSKKSFGIYHIELRKTSFLWSFDVLLVAKPFSFSDLLWFWDFRLNVWIEQLYTFLKVLQRFTFKLSTGDHGFRVHFSEV